MDMHYLEQAIVGALIVVKAKRGRMNEKAWRKGNKPAPKVFDAGGCLAEVILD
jgi:hypothetical protein